MALSANTAVFGHLRMAFNASLKNCPSSSPSLRQTLFIHRRHHSSNATCRFPRVKFFAVPANAKTAITEETPQSHYVHPSTSTSECFPFLLIHTHAHTFELFEGSVSRPSQLIILLAVVPSDAKNKTCTAIWDQILQVGQNLRRRFPANGMDMEQTLARMGNPWNCPNQ